MRSLHRLAPVLAVVLAACGTATGAALPLVRHHATIDLDCPEAEVRIEEQLGGRYKAVGCGRKATYRTACDGLTCDVKSEEDTVIPWKDRPEPGG
jgi:hypothetical protein